jgi:hypothetical protein
VSLTPPAADSRCTHTHTQTQTHTHTHTHTHTTRQKSRRVFAQKKGGGEKGKELRAHEKLRFLFFEELLFSFIYMPDLTRRRATSVPGVRLVVYAALNY